MDRQAERVRKATSEVLEIESPGASSGANRRVDERFSAKSLGPVKIEVHCPPSLQTLIVQPRDLSSSGASLLHLNFMHTGTTVVLILPRLDGLTHRCEGKVLRCRFVGGRVHELGVRFDKQIDPADFLVGCSNNNADFESMRLAGSVLWVSDNRINRDVARVLLEELGVTMLAAEDFADAMTQAMSVKLEALVVDSPDSVSEAATALKELREVGFVGPALACLDALHESAADALSSAGYANVSAKPTCRADLARLLCDALPEAEKDIDIDEALVSEMWSQQALRPTIREFVGHLPEELRDITGVLKSEDKAKAVSMLGSLRSAATSVGYPVMAKAVQRLIDTVTKNPADPTISHQMDGLGKLAAAAVAGLKDDS